MDDNSNQVVLRFRDGRTDRVDLDPIDVAHEVLTVHRENGEKAEIPFGELKAVFFPRLLPDEQLEPAHGSTLAIEFSDGEVIRGMAQYNPERNGFYLFPLDRSKNDRIFVVNSAIMSIEVERL